MLSSIPTRQNKRIPLYESKQKRKPIEFEGEEVLCFTCSMISFKYLKVFIFCNVHSDIQCE